MKRSFLGVCLLLCCLAAFAPSAMAATVYVGSWQVFDPNAPSWGCCAPNGPLAYTGREVAAMLFGGSPSDYAISTNDSTPANINFSAWYDVIGMGEHLFNQDHNSKYLGQYYGPTSGYGGSWTNAASAWIQDNGVTQTNYAFRVDAAAPEPSTWMLMTGSLALLGLARKSIKRRS